MKTFDYLEPKDLTELVKILETPKDKQKRKLMAGGTDLMVEMKKGLIAPECLINIKKVKELHFIKVEYDRLKIGATTPLAVIEKSEMIKNDWKPISEAAHKIGSVQIRNLGTIGGNLCHASPAADMAPILIGLGAELKFLSHKGERVEDLDRFFLGPGETSIQEDEVLVEISVPRIPPSTGAVYFKFGPREAMDIPITGVASVITLKEKKRSVGEARIVLGAVAPIPMRAVKAEIFLVDKEMTTDAIKRAGEIASEECKPISDIRSSAEYRRELVKVLTKRSIIQAAEIATLR